MIAMKRNKQSVPVEEYPVSWGEWLLHQKLPSLHALLGLTFLAAEEGLPWKDLVRHKQTGKPPAQGA